MFDLLEGQRVEISPVAETGIGAEVGIDVEFGKSIGGELKVEAPEIKEKEEEKKEDKKPGEWTLLTMTSIFFQTGSPDIDPVGDSKIASVVRDIEEFIAEAPQQDIRVEVVGHASPRWRTLKRGQINAQLNQALSEQRAHQAMEHFQTQFPRNNEGTCDFTQQATPGPEEDIDEKDLVIGRGSLDALAEGADKDDNSKVFRRADVSIFHREVVPAGPT